MGLAVLVPVSFETSDPEPIVLSLKLAQFTSPRLIVLVVDEKGGSLAAAERAVAQLGSDQISLEIVNARDTGIRWGMGLDHLVRIVRDNDLGVDRVLVMPGDSEPSELTGAKSAAFSRALLGLVTKAERHDVTLGDYSIRRDSIKQTWDAFHTLPFLSVLDPENALKVAHLRITKLRTEFFCLKLNRIPDWVNPMDFPSDPTPFVLMSVLRHGGSVAVHDLGDFADEDPGRVGLLPKIYQSVRLALEMGVDYAARERREARNLEEDLDQQIVRSREMRSRLSALFSALDSSLNVLEGQLVASARLNPKIDGNTWAKVLGISYLLESAESSYEGYELSAPGLNKLRTIPGHSLYARLAEAAEWLGRRLENYGVQLLPVDSYHATYRDLVSSLDLSILPDQKSTLISRLLSDFAAMKAELEPLPQEGEFDAITFRAGEISIWGSALVVKLKPADTVSTERLEQLKKKRLSEHSEWCSRHEIPRGPGLTPHVTLLYFEDAKRAQSVRSNKLLMTESRSVVRSLTGDSELVFHKWSLHGFQDMATFFRLE